MVDESVAPVEAVVAAVEEDVSQHPDAQPEVVPWLVTREKAIVESHARALEKGLDGPGKYLDVFKATYIKTISAIWTLTGWKDELITEACVLAIINCDDHYKPMAIDPATGRPKAPLFMGDALARLLRRYAPAGRIYPINLRMFRFVLSFLQAVHISQLLNECGNCTRECVDDYKQVAAYTKEARRVWVVTGSVKIAKKILDAQPAQLYCLVGLPGVGKHRLIKRLCNTYPNKICTIVRFTTRPIQEKEKDGIHYFFVSKDMFNTTEMIEESVVCGYQYGTSLLSIAALDPEKIYITTTAPENAQYLTKGLPKNIVARTILLDVFVDREAIAASMVTSGRDLSGVVECLVLADSFMAAIKKHTSSFDEVVRYERPDHEPAFERIVSVIMVGHTLPVAPPSAPEEEKVAELPAADAPPAQAAEGAMLD